MLMKEKQEKEPQQQERIAVVVCCCCCSACPQEGIISIGHIYFHGSLIVRLSKHGNTFKIAMKSGKWDARANKMPIFYGPQQRLKLELKLELEDAA